MFFSLQSGTDQDKIDKICEMAAVMRKAIEVDERQSTHEQELISQLQFENRTLREVLQISSEANVQPPLVEKDTQTNLSDSESENLNDSVIEVCDSSTIKRKPNTNSKQGSSPKLKGSPGKADSSDSTTSADNESNTESESKMDTTVVVKNCNENEATNDEKKDVNANSSTASA